MDNLIFLTIGCLVVMGIIGLFLQSANKQRMEQLLNAPDFSERAEEELLESIPFTILQPDYTESDNKLSKNAERSRKMIEDFDCGRLTDVEFAAEAESVRLEAIAILNEMPPTLTSEELMEQFKSQAEAIIPISSSSSNFVPTKKYICGSKRVGMALDPVAMKLALLTPHSKEVISIGQIVGVEVCVDSETVISTDRVSQIGGAVVGGMLTGGIGALVVAMGAKKKHEQKIKSLELKLLVSGSSSPTHRVLFFGTGDHDPKAAMEEVTDWHDTITVLMKEFAALAPQSLLEKSLKTSTGLSTYSLADEIRKLNDLFREGVISEDEYSKAKTSLI